MRGIQFESHGGTRRRIAFQDPLDALRRGFCIEAGRQAKDQFRGGERAQRIAGIADSRGAPETNDTKARSPGICGDEIGQRRVRP